jgi:hypothetical protein
VVAYPRNYSAPEQPEVVTVEPATYVTITGQGAPGGELHLSATEALYAVATGIQGGASRAGREFALPPLEGQWWFDEDKPAAEVPRDEWHWKLMIRVPESVTKEEVTAAKRSLAGDKNARRVEKVELETMNEGQSVQMLHVGPYDAEPETVARIFAFMKEGGLVPNGLHHEIYLSDIRKEDPARARTIIRYPVKRS